VDRRRVYLGQQLTYVIRLYARVDVSEFDGVKLPGFDGFWGEDLESPTHPMPTIQNVDGVPYQVYLIKKKALFPSHSGKLTIGAAEADISAGGVFFRGRRLHRATQPIDIDVLPLPAGAPAGFSTSNVGSWQLSAKLNPAQVAVGEPASLTFSLQGVGNLHALVLPKLPPIPGLRLYDPTSTDKVSVTADRFGGIRRVEIVLVGQRTGEFEIPSIDFSSFDPQTQTYSTQKTPPFELKVTPAQGGPGAQAAGQNLLEESFRPIRPEPERSTRRLPSLSGRALALTFALPPLLLLLGWLVEGARRRRAASAPAARERRAYRAARKRLKAARASLERGDPEGALAELTQALTGYLEDRTRRPIAGLTHAELRAELARRGADDASAEAAVRALEDCELRRYAPGARGAQDGQALLSAVEFALDSLERTGLQASRRAA
ncbi:MAG: BatD family protein, partial [Deltaproteobacteria bacterium]